MKAIKNALKTLADTLRVVTQAGSYSVDPLLSFIIMPLVTFTAIIPPFEGVLGADQNTMTRIIFFLEVYLAYGVLYFVSAFGDVALVNATFALAAYRYATVRKSDLFPGDPTYAEHAFVKTNKATDAGAAPAASTSDARPAASDPSN